MAANGTNKWRKSDTALALGLARGLSVKVAAESANLSQRTAQRRLANVEFRALIDSIRTQMLSEATGKLTDIGLLAVQTLEHIALPAFNEADDLHYSATLAFQRVDFVQMTGPSLRPAGRRGGGPAGPAPRYPAPDPGRRRPGSPAQLSGTSIPVNRGRVPPALTGPELGAVDGGSSYVAIRPGAVAIITGWLRCAEPRPDYIVTGPGRRAGGAPEQPDELNSRC